MTDESTSQPAGTEPARPSSELAEATPLVRWVVRILFVVVFAAFIGALVMGARHPRNEPRPDTDRPAADTDGRAPSPQAQ